MKKVLPLLLMLLALLVVFVSCDEPKHEHSFGTEWKYDANSHWHEATCEHTDVKGDEAKHTLVPVEAKEPTCTEIGWEGYVKCSVCDYTTYKEKPAIGHTFATDWTKDATHHWHKATCEHSSEVSDKAEHDWNEGVETTAPDYGTTGVKTYTCNTCGQTKTETISALDAKDNTVTYNGSSSKDYDGNAIELDSSKITRSGDGAITFMYKKSTEEDSAYAVTAPKDAGTYKVKISVAATSEWKGAETVVEYTINKVVLPLQNLTMTYEVLPEATGSGIAAYKSKLFTSADGLPEGVTINVFPYNEDETGTFTVREYKYKLFPNTEDDSAFETALQGVQAGTNSLDPDQFFVRVDLGTNYTLPINEKVATLTVTPKGINGNITKSKDYDGKASFEIMGEDLVSKGVYEQDKDAVKLHLTVADANAGSSKTVTGAEIYYQTKGTVNHNYVINDSNVSYNLTINKKTLTVPTRYSPVLSDSSGNTIDSRVVEIGAQYGALENFTITLKSSWMQWGTNGYSATFYSKTEKPESASYYEMDEQNSKNYSLNSVFLNINKQPSQFSNLILGQEYSTAEHVSCKFTASAGRKYIVKIDKKEPIYAVTDSTGRILAPDENGFITPVIDGEVYLWIVGQLGVTSWTYKVYQMPLPASGT